MSVKHLSGERSAEMRSVDHTTRYLGLVTVSYMKNLQAGREAVGGPAGNAVRMRSIESANGIQVYGTTYERPNELRGWKTAS